MAMRKGTDDDESAGGASDFSYVQTGDTSTTISARQQEQRHMGHSEEQEQEKTVIPQLCIVGREEEVETAENFEEKEDDEESEDDEEDMEADPKKFMGELMKFMKAEIKVKKGR